MRNGSNFVFERVDLLSYHIHKTSLKRGKLYIKPPKWIENKNATINAKNNDDECFKRSIVIALHHLKIGKHAERLSNIHDLYSYGYNWEGIEFPAGIKDWKRFEKIMKQLLLMFCLYHMKKKQ